MTDEIYQDPEPSVAAKDALAVIERGCLVPVTDQASLTAANVLLRDIKALRRRFDEEFDKGIKQAFEHHRHLVAQKKKWTDPLDAAERALKPKISAFLAEEDRKRLEAERAAFQADRKVRMEADKSADAVHDLISEGRVDEADKVMTEALAKIEKIKAAAPAVPPPPVAEGIVLREVWNFEVENFDLVPRKFLKVDEVKLRGYVVAMKHQAEIPGVRVWSSKVASVRGPK